MIKKKHNIFEVKDWNSIFLQNILFVFVFYNNEKSSFFFYSAGHQMNQDSH